jgi:hypothetical protein
MSTMSCLATVNLGTKGRCESGLDTYDDCDEAYLLRYRGITFAEYAIGHVVKLRFTQVQSFIFAGSALSPSTGCRRWIYCFAAIRSNALQRITSAQLTRILLVGSLRFHLNSGQSVYQRGQVRLSSSFPNSGSTTVLDRPRM